jgi:hypothetical protein
MRISPGSSIGSAAVIWDLGYDAEQHPRLDVDCRMIVAALILIVA